MSEYKFINYHEFWMTYFWNGLDLELFKYKDSGFKELQKDLQEVKKNLDDANIYLGKFLKTILK